MGLRKDELLASVDNLIRVHEAWVLAENRPNPDATYWDAVGEMVACFDTGDIPGDCRDLAIAVERFAAQVEEFESREDVDSYYPDNEFWEAYEDVVQARGVSVDDATTDEIPPLEPMHVLHDQGVPHRQIAVMYGLKLANGEPATHLVAREIAKPGTVLGPGWKDPRQKNLESAKSDQKEHLGRQKKSQKSKTDAAVAACPESPRELWEQEVPIEQASRMLKRSMAEVQELYDGFTEEREAEAETRKRIASKPSRTKAKARKVKPPR